MIFYPWVECNTKEPARIETVVRGCRAWRPLTDTVLVSTEPRLEVVTALYKRLVDKLPGMAIIPGIKTSAALRGRPDSVEGWLWVAEKVRRACEITGSRRCAIENESGWRRYLTGDYEIDWHKQKKALAALPAGIEIIWYPGVLAPSRGRPGAAERSLSFMQEVNACVPQLKVVTLGYAGRDYEWSPAQEAHQHNLELGQDAIPILYMYGREQDWRPEDWGELEKLLAAAGIAECMIYPRGIHGLEATGRAIKREKMLVGLRAQLDKQNAKLTAIRKVLDEDN